MDMTGWTHHEFRVTLAAVAVQARTLRAKADTMVRAAEAALGALNEQDALEVRHVLRVLGAGESLQTQVAACVRKAAESYTLGRALIADRATEERNGS